MPAGYARLAGLRRRFNKKDYIELGANHLRCDEPCYPEGR